MQNKKIIKIVLKPLKELMVLYLKLGVSVEDRAKKSKLDDEKFCGTKHWETNYNSSIKDPYQDTRGKRPAWSLHKPPY